MNITKENYEAYFLDYHEGNLTESQKAELMDFLVQNPELKKELEAFEVILLDDTASVTMKDKDFLKKPVAVGNSTLISDDQMIGWYEGDLDETEKEGILKAVAENVELRKDFSLYGMVRLDADTSIVFPGKSSLKKYVLGSRTVLFRQMAAAAAILAFLISLYWLFPEPQTTTRVAEVPTNNYVPESMPGKQAPDISSVSPSSLPLMQQKAPAVERQPEATAEQPDIIRQDASQLIQMASLSEAEVTKPTRVLPSSIEKRQEFYWFSYTGANDLLAQQEETIPDEDNSPTPQPSEGYTSLASLAYNRFEKSTGIDIQRIEAQVTQRSFGLWDIAGIGLAGISHLTGSSLTIEKEVDENGRITTLGVGERFRISR